MLPANQLRVALVAFIALAVLLNLLVIGATTRLDAATWAALGTSSAALLLLAALLARSAARRSTPQAAERALTQGLLSAHVQPLFVVAHDGTITDVNAVALTATGLAREQLVGRPLADRFSDAEAVRVALDKAHARGSVAEALFTLRASGSGAARDVALGAGVMAAEGSEPRRLLVTLFDVTEARRRQADSAQQATYARSLIESAEQPLFAITPEGKISDVNEAAVAKTGMARDRLCGTAFGSLFTEPALAQQACLRSLAEGRVEGCPLALRQPSGRLLELSLSTSLYRDEAGVIVGIFAQVSDVTLVRKAERERDAKDWVATGIGRLNAVFQEQAEARELARRILSELCQYLGVQVGALYVVEADAAVPTLSLFASHAYSRRKHLATRFVLGEGLVGQAALERKQLVLSEVPPDYLHISSGLGEAVPRCLCLTPLLFEGSVKGVVELASLSSFSDAAMAYLEQAAPTVAVSLEASASRERVAQALHRAQVLATELEAQQEALRSTNAELAAQQETLRNANAELEEQTAQVEISEQRLQAQQTEIELTNSDLRRQNELLERQTRETEEARRALSIQAEEVALASKYKSEFLANMSHELRTPLNSLLLLARSLRDNSTQNLTPDQVESATVIFESGSDLLNLINEILDLSKIEAGKMELRPEELDLADLARALESQFGHMAVAQALTLGVVLGADAPATIVTDAQRLGQVLKNLLGNALKFTEVGGVKVTFALSEPHTKLARSGLAPGSSLAVHVQDTGIGIPLDKQKLIFEAFQQADSGDRRRFGGTGLGLSISRELVALLGGEIQLVSVPGQGSTFSVFLPLDVRQRAAGGVSAGTPVGTSSAAPASRRAQSVPAPRVAPAATAANDDRDAIGEQDRVVLVIEDDLRFGKILAGHVRARGFRCLQAVSGEEGLQLAREHRPHGIVLDIQLPGVDGWTVLNALKQDVSLRHIPVHIVSVDEPSPQNLRIGAIGHASKPIDEEEIRCVLDRLESASAHAQKVVLVVEDDEIMRKETVRIIGNGNVKVREVATGREALAALRSEAFNLVVMDLGLPDMQGTELLKTIAEEKLPLPPVIIHTVRDLSMDEEYFLRNYSESIILKDVRSQERLIDEVALFLHRVVRDLPEENRRAILHLRESDEPLRGRKVLIVEDDMRTMFAMARMLAGHGVYPLKAENGQRALELLAEHPDADLVLLDMMMPVMDGYEAARRIREQPAFQKLPIIALTAKAMKEDRKKCLDAGATDYLSKPVDPDRLASLMRVLLCH